MEIKEITEKKNLVFERREIEATVVSDSSPSNKETLTELAKKLSTPEDSIKIKGIHGEFGTTTFKVTANVYKSKEDKDKIEKKTKKEIEAEKKAIEEAKKAAQEAKKKAEEEKKAAEEAEKQAAEKPAEEKTPEENKSE